MRMPGIVAVAAGSPAPCRLRTAMAGTVVAPHEFTEGETFFLVIDEEEPGWIRLVLHADSRALTPPRCAVSCTAPNESGRDAFRADRTSHHAKRMFDIRFTYGR